MEQLNSNPLLSNLSDGLLSAGCIKFGEFTLKSGQKSPVYLDLRRLVSYPAILKRVGQAYAEILSGLEYDRIAGIPYSTAYFSQLMIMYLIQI